jgi:hypothetical protein
VQSHENDGIKHCSNILLVENISTWLCLGEQQGFQAQDFEILHDYWLDRRLSGILTTWCPRNIIYFTHSGNKHGTVACRTGV